jgi:hypothetical protein
VKRSARVAARRVDAMFSARGPGFRALAVGQAASVAGDTLITMGLAGTLFFQVPSAEARDNVALYLLLTLAPFAVLGPLLGAVFARIPTAYRAGFVLGSGLRVVVAILMLLVGLNTLWLYPLAFGLLVFSRIQGISRSSLLPLVVDQPIELVSANARLARIGVMAGASVVPIGALLIAWLGGWPALVLATVAFGWATYAGITLPVLRPVERPPEGEPERERGRRAIPRTVRLARLATAGVRFLNGFLVLLVAFEFRDADAGFFDFGALLGAAGGGFLVAAFVSPVLERRLREEPMVVSALAVEAAAAFIAAQGFGLGAAAALAAAAGFAWGTAKFGFDGLLQATVDPRDRGAAFVASETSFQVVWVLGAIIPVLIDVPIEVGLVAAGVTALAAQVIYISGLLVPFVEARRADQSASMEHPDRPPRHDVTEYW